MSSGVFVIQLATGLFAMSLALSPALGESSRDPDDDAELHDEHAAHSAHEHAMMGHGEASASHASHAASGHAGHGGALGQITAAQIAAAYHPTARAGLSLGVNTVFPVGGPAGRAPRYDAQVVASLGVPLNDRVGFSIAGAFVGARTAMDHATERHQVESAETQFYAALSYRFSSSWAVIASPGYILKVNSVTGSTPSALGNVTGPVGRVTVAGNISARISTSFGGMLQRSKDMNGMWSDTIGVDASASYSIKHWLTGSLAAAYMDSGDMSMHMGMVPMPMPAHGHTPGETMPGTPAAPGQTPATPPHEHGAGTPPHGHDIVADNSATIADQGTHDMSKMAMLTGTASMSAAFWERFAATASVSAGRMNEMLLWSSIFGVSVTF